MAFAGFFRLGEITVPSASGYDPQQYLSFGDVSVDSRLALQLLCVHLRRSKTDQFGRGADIYPGRTDNELGPVAAVLAYLAARGDGAGPLFRRADGLPLTTSWFISEVRGALAICSDISMPTTLGTVFGSVQQQQPRQQASRIRPYRLWADGAA